MKKTTSLLILLSIILSSCNTQNVIVSKDKQVKKDTTITNVEPIKIINTDSINNVISNYIKFLVSDLDSGNYVIDKQNIFSKSLLPNSYINSNYSQLWLSEKNKNDAIFALQHSDEHGLLPSDYHMNEINKLNGRYSNLSNQERAFLDILITDGIILYAYHLIRGKVNPHDLSFSWNFIEHQFPEDTKQYLYEALDQEKLNEALYSLEPQDDEYTLLKRKLAENKAVISDGGWEIVEVKTPLHEGDTDKGIIQLRKRLAAQGYYQEEEVTTLNSLISTNDTVVNNIYDTKLVLAVKHFQKEHGLNYDGVIGKHTLSLINTSAKEYQKKIICSLERRRWIKYPTDEPYIKVNIPAYKMEFVENNKAVYSSNAVIGKINKKTPMFTERLKLVVLNPTWTLPRSITTTETLSRLKANPNYLDKHNMDLIDSQGNIVNNHDIDWNKYKKGHFPYTVRQGPGPNNALGQVKFLFPNKYSIYLHDTPSKYLFAKEKRAFSHGCIRLQNPLDFAEFLLKRENKTYWTRNKIDEIIKTSKTKNIRLKHEYPVLLMYLTAGYSVDGDVFYLEDVYNRDVVLYKKIIEENAVLYDVTLK
jgi:murein L,D-transpeptidase YcbB/YkuD